MSPKSLRNYKKKLREDLAQKQIAYLASKRTFTQSATANPRQAQNTSICSGGCGNFGAQSGNIRKIN